LRKSLNLSFTNSKKNGCSSVLFIIGKTATLIGGIGKSFFADALLGKKIRRIANKNIKLSNLSLFKITSLYLPSKL